MGCLFSCISGDSASHFIAIILKCTLAPTRMGLGRVTCSSKGHIKGQFAFLIAKFRSFYVVYFQLIFLADEGPKYLPYGKIPKFLWIVFILVFLGTSHPVSVLISGDIDF